jgi:hypothetical protein
MAERPPQASSIAKTGFVQRGASTMTLLLGRRIRKEWAPQEDRAL